MEDIIAALRTWPDEWMKYEGPIDDTPVPPLPGTGARPSQPAPVEQNDPPECNEEQDESQKTISDSPSGGEAGGDKEQGVEE